MWPEKVPLNNFVQVCFEVEVVLMYIFILKKCSVLEFPDAEDEVDEEGKFHELNGLNWHKFIKLICPLIVPHQHYFIKPVCFNEEKHGNEIQHWDRAGIHEADRDHGIGLCELFASVYLRPGI